MKTFQSESDVRDWVRDNAPHVWWVENKSGGTFGFPDAIVPLSYGVRVDLELKMVEVHQTSGAKTIKAAPKQLDIIKELRDWGIGAWFLCGLEGSELIGVLGPENLVKYGKGKKRPAYKVAGGAWFRGSEYQLLFDYLRENI